MFSVEICVPAAQIDLAVRAIQSSPDLYKQDKEPVQMEFYHPQKGTALRFQMISISPSLYLEVLTNETLFLRPADFQQGLTKVTASEELYDVVGDVDDNILGTIRWPKLGPFVECWLRLSLAHEGTIGYVYLSQAEKLIDCNNLDQAWCEQNLEDEKSRAVAIKIIRGKSQRRSYFV